MQRRQELEAKTARDEYLKLHPPPPPETPEEKAAREARANDLAARFAAPDTSEAIAVRIVRMLAPLSNDEQQAALISVRSKLGFGVPI